MNQNDHQLITHLSEKLKQAQPVNKDQEAAQLITSEIASQPDATYLLTQAVLLQEEAIRNLQQQVSEMQSQMKPKRGFFSSFLGPRETNNQPTFQNSSNQFTPNHSFGQGSFLGSALSTATGVAGGLFLFEGISRLFSGNSNSFLTSGNTLNNSAVANPFANQDQTLNDGFGTGDSFMDSADNNFDDGFGSGSDWF